MDDAPIPPPPMPPGCEWQEFCEHLPQLWQQIEEMAQAQREMNEQLVLMNNRDSLMARSIADLAGRQKVGDYQLRKVLEGINTLAGSPSGFVGIARELRGSYDLTRRIWKILIAVAGGLAAIFGVLHLTDSNGEMPPEPPASMQEPRGDG